MENLEFIVDKCVITVESEKGIKELSIDFQKFPSHKTWHNKKIGDFIFKVNGEKCKIIKIMGENREIAEIRSNIKTAINNAEIAIRDIEKIIKTRSEPKECIFFAESAKQQIKKAILSATRYFNELFEEIQIADRIMKKLDEKIFELQFGGIFPPEYIIKYLLTDKKYSYDQVEKIFGISIVGFGTGITPTRSAVVLISSIKKVAGHFVYHDKWCENGDYIYSGEGKVGDQVMTPRNRAIRDAEQEGKGIHLFIKFSPQEYYYQGIFKLIDYTYEDDYDENGALRKEYKFRLRKAIE